MVLKSVSAAFGLVCLATGCFAVEVDHSVQKERLDLAGKQRMLIQRIVKSTCIVLANVESKDYAERTKDDAAAFDEVLTSLIAGSQARTWDAEENPDVRAVLQEVYDLWDKLRPNALQVAHGDMSASVISQVLNTTDATVAKMNEAVAQIQVTVGSKNMDPRLSKTINSAGRQRMLTQKMAKEFCFLFHDVRADEKRVALTQSMKLFEDTLTSLRNATPDGSGFVPASALCTVHLDKAEAKWSALKPILSRTIAGEPLEDEDFLSVVHLSSDLLADMVAAVNIYVAGSS